MRKDRVTHGIDRIMQAIVDKEFELEQAMPGDAKLAKFLDVSRPTMREVVLLRHKFCSSYAVRGLRRLSINCARLSKPVDPSVPCGSDFVGR